MIKYGIYGEDAHLSLSDIMHPEYRIMAIQESAKYSTSFKAIKPSSKKILKRLKYYANLPAEYRNNMVRSRRPEIHFEVKLETNVLTYFKKWVNTETITAMTCLKDKKQMPYIKYRVFSKENYYVGELIPTCVQLPHFPKPPYSTARISYRLVPIKQNEPLYLLFQAGDAVYTLFSDYERLCNYIKANKLKKDSFHVRKTEWLNETYNNVRPAFGTIAKLKVLDKDGDFHNLYIRLDTRYFKAHEVSNNKIFNKRQKTINVIAVAMLLISLAIIILY